jgi:glycyl-tRNA synthetase beta chain
VTTTGELLLELLCEEIPARMQQRAIDELQRLIGDRLAAAQIPPAAIAGHVTPRRLVLVAQGIPQRQPDRREERRGPRLGAPAQALDGFLRGAGLSRIEDCDIRDTGRGEFYFAVVEQRGRDTATVLPELLRAAIAELPWPKSMRFPASGLRWIRPLNSAICLFDGAILPLPLDAVPVGRTTMGHRWLSNGPVAVESGADYAARLEAAHVVIDRDARRRRIEAGLAGAAETAQVTVVLDPELLDEVTGLAEYPVVMIGAIDPEFMTLPPEVLRASMRTHQRYFSCLNPDGSPAARFLFVADNLAADGGKTIVAGNERVLRARLSDARFFWDQDRKTRLADRVEALRGRVYHEKLGTMYDKAERMEKLAAYIAEQIASQPSVAPAKAGAQGGGSDGGPPDSRFRGNHGGDLVRLSRRAARLAKADLSTAMVGEFPELQGIMGRYYALHDGEDRLVADAIGDHYKPLGPRDTCPTQPVSIAVALADKIDSLARFFDIGERPSGSRDPFALRRAALGMIRVLLENKIRLRLGRLFGAAGIQDPSALKSLLDFVVDRLRVHLRETGVRHDLISAAFRSTEDDLLRLVVRVDALNAFLDSDDGANLLIGYKRAANIVGIEERRDRHSYSRGREQPELLREVEEKRLARSLRDVSTGVRALMDEGEFEQALATLAQLRRPIDEFFEKVTVNTDDRGLRDNRLRLLAHIRDTMNQVADFSQIEG